MDQPKYAERNAVVLGVSLDSVDSHKKFCAQQGLTFKLLADADHKVTDAYGSLLQPAAGSCFLGEISKAPPGWPLMRFCPRVNYGDGNGSAE